ncbi:hypothetical protein VPH35_024041 [Triticum aestivum]
MSAHATSGKPVSRRPQAKLVMPALMALELIVATVAAVPLALPGCPEACGRVTVPYPFGFRQGCFHAGFNLTCDHTPPSEAAPGRWRGGGRHLPGGRHGTCPEQDRERYVVRPYQKRHTDAISHKLQRLVGRRPYGYRWAAARGVVGAQRIRGHRMQLHRLPRCPRPFSQRSGAHQCLCRAVR